MEKNSFGSRGIGVPHSREARKQAAGMQWEREVESSQPQPQARSAKGKPQTAVGGYITSKPSPCGAFLSQGSTYQRFQKLPSVINWGQMFKSLSLQGISYSIHHKCPYLKPRGEISAFAERDFKRLSFKTI